MQKTFLYALSCLSILGFFKECSADIAVVGGYGQTIFSSDAPNYPLANSFSIGKNFASPIAVPLIEGNILTVTVDRNTGDVVWGGDLGDLSLPAIYRGSVISSSVTPVLMPSDTNSGGIISAAFDSKGNAILGGGDLYPENSPIAFRLASGSNQATSITLPGSTDGGVIRALAIFPNDTAILVGENQTTSAPFVYIVPKGAEQAIKLSLPDPSIQGSLTCVAINSEGTAVLAGHDSTNNQALIYRLAQGSYLLEPISVPEVNDNGFINSVAFTSNGTAILAGSTTVPLIYSLLPGSNAASTIANPNGNEGELLAVVVGSDNVALIGGRDSTANLPIIYRVSPGSFVATSLIIPTSEEGSLFGGAIGSENVAVFAGANQENSPIIYTVSSQGTTASVITYSNPFPEGVLGAVAIYSSTNNLYDKNRINPYYNNQLNESKNALKKGGIL